MAIREATEELHRRESAPAPHQRRLAIGAEVVAGGGAHFRVWAPRRREVEVVLEEGAHSVKLVAELEGYFSGLVKEAQAGTLYKFRLDGSDTLYPDPASRFQPQGPHGPSQVIDPESFSWSDQGWKGIGREGQVVYEMHIGTFTREGTYATAERHLADLAELGVTCIEVMPLPEFPGEFGWGYDGVDLFAPYHVYGTPDAFRQFVDRAHAVGLAVILDVVYNHIGPDGNYLREFSESYFSQTHQTDWGDALNFDGPGSGPVREFFLSNAQYWIEEFHLDGFRFDATQAIVDDSPEHLLKQITQRARSAAGEREIYLVNENEPQHTKLVRKPAAGGYGMDALWNDDFHHSAMVALTGHNEAYYTDHFGTPQEFISAGKWGYLYQGQRYRWQKRRRGTPALDLPPTAFVHFLQNHDQIANYGRGYRAHQLTSPSELRAMTVLMLLMPQTPMLFQGQEFAASSTFHYFADHNPELAKLVCAGRAKEMSQFPSVATPAMQACLLDPGDVKTFTRCKLDHGEREVGFHEEIYRLHRDLLRLRREEQVFRQAQCARLLDGAVLGPQAFLLRFFTEPTHADGTDDRLLLVNFGRDLSLQAASEPLLAPPPEKRWSIQLSSDEPCYGGSGTAHPDTEDEGWLLPGRCAILLKPMGAADASVATRARVAGSAQEARRRTD